MGATNRMLAKRVGELTEALADVRAQAEEVKEAEDMAEVTDTADEIIADINAVIGSEDDDENSDEEESGDEQIAARSYQLQDVGQEGAKAFGLCGRHSSVYLMLPRKRRIRELAMPRPIRGSLCRIGRTAWR